ncbi:AraC family transcriptional regulator [Aestuariicella sp. G3-2]|uniref:AraC family transcriptional regulator n=1 Tax=Pseudomaricurvus albidus TaxID=2842452 RepID=UPI001C0D9F93|nr:AraC family transcriptional regulator [Aestuariicella albida]MBU3069653.1 AraC family transcriptional regulator [Aestuariicella albida]
MSEPTVIGSWLTLFTAALDSYGVNSESFLLARGIDFETACDPNQRIPIITMNHLWDEAVAETGAEDFGLTAGSLMTPNTLSALGVAMWSACTIKEQLECFVRYQHVVAKVSQMELVEQDGVLISTTYFYHDAKGESLISDSSQDAICAALHSLRRTLYKRNYSPLKMELTRSTPRDAAKYEAFFGCPVVFNQSALRVHIRMEDAIAPIPGGSQYVSKAAERMLEDYVAQIQTSPDIIGQLRQALTLLLPQGKATMDQVVKQLHTSKRTFHRKLEEQGTSFREQMEEFRRELAFRYMAQDELSVGDISFLLGFSSSSNFTRAFKRWTGIAPQEYRSQLIMDDDVA